MTTHTLWSGYRSFTGDNNYEVVTFTGSEIGSVRFTDADSDVQYRVFRNENDNIIVFFVERRGYDCVAEIHKYPTFEDAKKDYAFILKKAGVI